MTPSVSPTSKTNTHHISLEELNNSSVKYGLILTPDGNAISRRPKVGSTHTPFTQKDWSGGRGIKYAIEDRSRFADSKRLNTRRAGVIALGGQETYVNGHRSAEQYMPSNAANTTWKALLGSDRYIAHRLTASANGNRAKIYFIVRRHGTPASTLKAELWTNTGTTPLAMVKSVVAGTDLITDYISITYEFAFGSVYGVTGAVDYHVMVFTSAADTATDYWEVLVDANGTDAKTKRSADGSTWSAATYDLYYRLVDDIDIDGIVPFEYKKAMYFLTRPTAGAAPKLYLNGYRGVATGAGGQTRTSLKDTTQTWTTNELTGAVIFFVDGPGSEQQQPWRLIGSNTVDTISWLSANPESVVAAQTVYVILGTNKLTLISGHGLTVLPTDIADTGDICYFAQGDATKMRRMQERNLAGVWTRSFAEEDNYAKLLKAYRDEANGMTVVKANDYDNSARPSVAVAKAEAWGTRLRWPYLLDKCDVTTGWTFSANVTGTADTAIYKTGSAAIKMVVAAGAADIIAYRAITPALLRKGKKIRLWVYSNAVLEANTLKFRLSASATCATAITNGDLPFPALEANEWTLVELPYKETDLGTVVSIGIFKVAKTGTVYIDGLESLPAGSEIPLGNEFERINGLELYGDPEVPWVIRTKSVGWIANGVFNPIPVREYAQIEGIANGQGHTVQKVYLYWSFGQGLQEWYRANLDDVGPNLDEGLPEQRQGYITSMIGYPGRIIANYDASNDGYSSILSRKGSGWHEDYRSDTLGRRIRFLYHQVVSGNAADRLWFCEGDDILWLPMAGNTVNELTDTTYRFTHEGYIQTGIIGNDEQRLFSSVKLGLENVTSTRCIHWDYRLDDATAWTPMSTAFDTGPVQELDLYVTGKRLELRFRPQTNTNTASPRITSIFVSTTEQPTPRYAYSMNFVYRDNGRDMLGNSENYTRAETIITQLDTWAANKTPLVMHSESDIFDNKTVFIEPLPIGPVAHEQAEQQEKQQGTLTVIEPS